MRIRIVAALSAAYDIGLGLGLLFGRPLLMAAFGLPAPVPPIHADLNGLFALAIGAGYVFPLLRPEAYRGYLWLMGPLLKGTGAVWFVGDVLWRGSPPSFLIFAVGDGSLAALTAWALVSTRTRQGAR